MTTEFFKGFAKKASLELPRQTTHSNSAKTADADHVRSLVMGLARKKYERQHGPQMGALMRAQMEQRIKAKGAEAHLSKLFGNHKNLNKIFSEVLSR